MTAISRRTFLRQSAAAGAMLLSASPHSTASASGARPSLVPGPQTKVRLHHDRPTFFIDGQPYTTPVFETYVPEARFFSQFAKAGTDIYSFSTNLGNGFSAPTWLGPDEWDFTKLDEIARSIVDVNPHGFILPRIYLTTPAWWTDLHPDECQVLSHGGTRYRDGLGHGRDGNRFPSLASEKWRADTAAALQHVIRHIQESPYGDRIFGYIITGLMTEEWYHWSIHSDELSDYSHHAVTAFHKWLRRKYRNREALRSAWADSRVDFSNATVPSKDARKAGQNSLTFRDPSAEMPVIDWYLFYNELVPETMDVFLRAAKEATDFKKVTGAFYCYMFEFGGDPEYGHNALSRLLRSQYLDFAAVTASYHNRALGTGADYARAPITSVGLHNKLWYHDNDTVSFRYDEMNKTNPDRSVVDRYRKELGVTETAQETIWQYRRGAGFVLGNGIFQSLFDLHGGYFDDPRLMEEVARLNSLFKELRQYDCSSVAQILVVSDETSCSYTTFESGFLQQTLQPAQVQFAKIGAPHDSILVDDLELADMVRYRFVIFLNCFHLSDKQRKLIRKDVLGRKRKVLWCYAPGLFNGAAASVDAMRELTGFSLRRPRPTERVRLRISLNDTGKEYITSARQSSASVIGHEDVWGEPFLVDDREATTLGTMEGEGGTTLAVKSCNNWTSIYAQNPVLPATVLRAIAEKAGVHLYNDHDDTFYASRSYFCLNADGSGERTLRFPEPVNLIDPFTGACLARKTKDFSHSFQDKETLLMRYELVHVSKEKCIPVLAGT